jgi:hypothetical protein
MWNLLIGPIAEVINTVLKRVLPAEKMSEEERAKLEAQVMLELSKQDFQSLMSQVEVNKIEAANPNWFVAGWRPACGWVGATALAYHYVIQPLASFILVAFFHSPFGKDLPVFDMESLMTILLGMLGLGSMRSFEKWAKVDGQH